MVRTRKLRAETQLAEGRRLLAAGKPGAAAAVFAALLRESPKLADAHFGLALALNAEGRGLESLRHAFEAFRLAPKLPEHRRLLAGLLRGRKLGQVSPLVKDLLRDLLQAGDIDHQDLFPTVSGLIACRPPLAEALTAGSEAPLPSGDQQRKLIADPLWCGLMEKTLIADRAFESWHRCMRARALLAAPDQELEPEWLAALALQADNSDYAWAEGPDERARLDELVAMIAKDRPLEWDRALLLLSLYRSPGMLPAEPAPPADAPLRRALHARVLASHREREIAASLPCLTEIETAVSTAVRAQYEDNPYPRWRALATRRARPLARIIQGLFPHLHEPLPFPEKPKVLVAGCGTGQHALRVAQRYLGAEVLAIDLSLRSLAYAAREAEARGIRNLRFAQADILGLDELEERFDLIECSGVLHHLAHPLAGWRILLGLLNPGGAMKIGLYSARAREPLVAARKWLDDQGFATDAEGLRNARASVLSVAEDHPAAWLRRQLDFYSLSGFRDLARHTQERSFSLPQIAETLHALGLEFLGFEFPSTNQQRAFRAQFGGGEKERDLALWERFEADHPDCFLAMYQFWCRKRVP